MEKSDLLKRLKFNLQEEKFPHFSDSELEELLISSDNNIFKASYEGCMIKAYGFETDLGPLKMTVNEKYWLRRARLFNARYNKSLGKRKLHRTMTRADGT